MPLKELGGHPSCQGVRAAGWCWFLWLVVNGGLLGQGWLLGSQMPVAVPFLDRIRRALCQWVLPPLKHSFWAITGWLLQAQGSHHRLTAGREPPGQELGA